MNLVLGAGIAGISAAYHLNQSGKDCLVFEKDNDWGGLCGNFEVNGFRFDKAIHLSFTENTYVKELFSRSTSFVSHAPEASNYYKGYWLKHPAQNNLYPLEAEEKVAIIADFVAKQGDEKAIANYEEWLRAQYGDYFAENFPIPYTRKYWTVEAKSLTTDWVGNRMYRPNIKEVLRGAFRSETPNAYYAKEMRYPKNGGYRAFLEHMAGRCDIRTGKEVIRIDPLGKKVFCKDGTAQEYSLLHSSIPLPEYSRLIYEMPEFVKAACERLQYTSIALVSFGFSDPGVPRHLWFYIYDEAFVAARCFSPSIKSADNVPEGCSSLQFEVYYSKQKPLKMNSEQLIRKVATDAEAMGVFDEKQVVVSDCRTLQYGNVIFYPGMKKDRQIILDYLGSLGISTIGRFGEWDYLWSDQSLLSGAKSARI